MNIVSLRSFEGDPTARPESESGGGGIGFERLLRGEIGRSPASEARRALRAPDGSREARSEDVASQRSRNARAFPTDGNESPGIDESDTGTTTTEAASVPVEESARAESPVGDAVVAPGDSERIGDPPAADDVASAGGREEIEVAGAARDAGRSGALPSQAVAAGAAGLPSAPSAARPGSAANPTGLAGTTSPLPMALDPTTTRSGSAAGGPGGAGLPGSGREFVRGASDADGIRGSTQREGAAREGRSSASMGSLATPGQAVAASPARESATEGAADVGGRPLPSQGRESDAVRTGTETGTLEARLAGRAARLAGGATDRAASSGASRSEGAGPAIDSRAPGVPAATEGSSRSDRRGRQNQEGGHRAPAGASSSPFQLAESASPVPGLSGAGADAAAGGGPVLSAVAAVEDSTGVTATSTGVSAPSAAIVGTTVQPGGEAAPTGASSPAPAADALAVQTEWLATRGGGSARLVLHPPELGEIAIRVHVRDGAVDVVMIAQEAAAKVIAEEQSDRLAHAFSARDLRLGSFEVRPAETRAGTEGSPDAQLGNPDAHDGGRSSRDPSAGGDGDLDRLADTRPASDGPGADPSFRGRSIPAERSIDLRI